MHTYLVGFKDKVGNAERRQIVVEVQYECDMYVLYCNLLQTCKSVDVRKVLGDGSCVTCYV